MFYDYLQRRKQAAFLTVLLTILLIATYPAFGQRGQSCTILAQPRPMPNGTSLPLAVTPDGRYTLFSSTANNLIPGDTNGQTDLFLYDILRDVYSRVSVGTGGIQAIGGVSQHGKMDAEARYVCFSSRAHNLVPGDTNGREDVFLHDRQTGNTICLSTLAGSITPNGGIDATMALGGRFAGLSLNRTSPVGRPYSAYVYDIVEQTYILISKDDAGNPADGESFMRDISENGRFVLFASNATGLDPRATDGRFYLYLHDRDSDDDGVFDQPGGTRTMLASMEGEGNPGEAMPVGWPVEGLAQGMLGGNWRVLFSPDGPLLHLYDVMREETMMMETAWNPDFSGLTSISDDARQLIYPKMMPGGHVQLVWRDMETGETRIASVTSVGQEANVAMSGNAGLGQRLISHGGQCVTFAALDSAAVPWVPGDFNGASDVLRHNFHHQTTTGISVTIGKRPNSAAGSPSASYDGSVIAFISDADDLVAGDLNEKADVFIKIGGMTMRIMAHNGAEPNDHSETPAVSADGHWVAFVSRASNLAPAAGTHTKDVYLYHIPSNSLTLVSNGMGGTPANEESVQPSISRDGNLVVFTSVASNLVPNDTNDASDVFLYDRTNNTIIRIQGAAGQPNGSSSDPVISADGRYIAFVSEASNLVQGDTNNRDDVFVYEVATGQMTIVRAHNGALANRNAFTVDINEDGRYVAFCSNSTNLVPNDTNDFRDIFVWDRLTGQIELVSVDAFGRQGNRDSIDPSISADGRYVAFLSESSNFMPSDKDIDYGPLGGEGSIAYDVDVFVADRHNGWLWYNVGSRGEPGNRPSQSPKLSGDGQSLVYVTHASNLECARTEPRDMGDILLHQGDRCLPPGDVDGDGQVDDRDLLAVLFDFGSEDSPADIVVNGMVDDADLLAVLFNYGTNCSAAGRGDRNDRQDQQLSLVSLQEPGKEESSGKSDENEGEVYVIRTAEPFDRNEWNRQTRELDLAHEGKWPYPVAGYGSEPWVSLYGDPLLWKDNGSQFKNDLFGSHSGGDFLPQAGSYTYSNSKTVSLGNSTVNIYVMGKLYIYATCANGGYFKAEAQGEAGVKLWSLNPKLAEAYGLAEAANNNFKLNAYFKVIGQTLWSKTLNQGLSYTQQGTIGPWAKNQSTSWTVWLGIVPIKVTVGFNASIGAHYYFFAGLFPTKAHAKFQPFVTSSAYVQAGLAWSLGCSASAGVGGSITLLNNTLTAEALGTVVLFDGDCCGQVTLKIHNQMTALGGSFYLYANACCWGLSGSKCGYLRRNQSWQHTLTSWPGYSASGDLFFWQFIFCI